MDRKLSDDVQWACQTILGIPTAFKKLNNRWHFILEKTKHKGVAAFAKPIKYFALPEILSNKDISEDVTKTIIEYMESTPDNCNIWYYFDDAQIINIFRVPLKEKASADKHISVQLRRYVLSHGKLHFSKIVLSAFCPDRAFPNNLEKFIVIDENSMYRCPKTGRIYPPCTFCHTMISKTRSCSICSQVHYCDRKCQKADWKKHKLVCQSEKKK